MIRALVNRVVNVRPVALLVSETLATTGITMLINFVASAIVARLLGPDGRGELAAILVWPQLLSLAFYFGLPASGVYNIKKNPQHVSITVGGIYTLACLAGLAANVAGTFLMPIVMHGYAHSVVLSSQTLLIFTAPSFIIYQISLSIIRAYDNFRMFNLARVLVPSLILFGLIILQIPGLLTPVSAAWTYGSSRMIALAWPLFWIWRACKPRFPPLGYSLRYLLRYSVRSACIDIVYAINEFLDRLAVIGMLSSASVGLYAAASNLALPMQEIGLAIVLVLFPKVAGLSERRAIEMTELAARLCFLAGVLAGLPLFVAAPIIVRICFGADFLEASSIFKILMVGIFFANTSFTLDQAFMATGRPGSVSVMVVIELILMSALLFMLVPTEGMHGAALARALTSLAGLLMRLVSFPLVLKRGIPRLYPRRSDLTALLERDRTDGG